MESGLITFGSLLPDPHTGERLSQRERLRDVVRAAVTAEELGFAWYTVGEHHFGERDVIPSPVVILAAIAERTSSIRLATGTTLVANRDPVLVAEDYALLSDGSTRAHRRWLVLPRAVRGLRPGAGQRSLGGQPDRGRLLPAAGAPPAALPGARRGRRHRGGRLLRQRRDRLP